MLTPSKPVYSIRTPLELTLPSQKSLSNPRVGGIPHLLGPVGISYRPILPSSPASLLASTLFPVPAVLNGLG